VTGVSNDELAVDFAVLKNEVKHLTGAVEKLSEALAENNRNVAAINGTLSEARGGWRVLMLVGGVSGAAGSGLTWLTQLFMAKPGP